MVHVPFALAVLHALHWSVHAVLQHTPSTHLPDAHCPGPVQATPLALASQACTPAVRPPTLTPPTESTAVLVTPPTWNAPIALQPKTMLSLRTQLPSRGSKISVRFVREVPSPPPNASRRPVPRSTAPCSPRRSNIEGPRVNLPVVGS